MQWYPVPAVCALDLTVGGILYTAAPFNGWYANTEVLRDLTDECRFNMLIPVAEALGMEIDTKPGEAPLWKDEVMHILSSAVYHSFKSAKIAMIDHHTLIDMFWAWYREEMKTRKYCPVNWKWVIVSRSSDCFRLSSIFGINEILNTKFFSLLCLRLQVALILALTRLKITLSSRPIF
jgi:nitric-oxide synthase